MSAALTAVTVTGTVMTEENVPATGAINAQLSAAISNGASPVYGTQKIQARLDANGSFSLPLVANDDTDVTPSGTTWDFTLALDGYATPWTFSVVVPHADAPSVDLFTLAPVTNSEVKYSYVWGINANGAAQLTGNVEFADTSTVTWSQAGGVMKATASPTGVTSIQANSGAALAGAVEFADSATVTWSEVAGKMEATSTGGGGGTPGIPALTLSTTDAEGSSGKYVETDATIAVFDTTTPAAETFGASGAVGTATVAARRDHVHAMPADPVTFAAPSLTLGTANAAGTSGEVLSTDATIAAFDTTVPVTQAFGDAAATGSATVTARRDHKHGMPANPVTAGAIEGTMAAKGNLLVGTGAGTGTQLTVGSDTQILTADSTQASGMKWAPGGGGGGTPGGTSGEIQYNHAGAFGGDTATTDGAGNWLATSLHLEGSSQSQLIVGGGAGDTPGQINLASGTGTGSDVFLTGDNVHGGIYLGDAADVYWHYLNASDSPVGSFLSGIVNIKKGVDTQQVQTAGALPTQTFTSGTGAQVSTSIDRTLDIPLTLTPTGAAAATVLIEKSPDGTTYSSVGTETVPAGTALDSFVRVYSTQLRAGWYVRFTATNATLGTATLS